MPYQILADTVLTIHVAIVLFVVGGLVMVVTGHFRGWRWVSNPWFRLAHVIAIVIVVLQAWLGVLCPLTTLEVWLRSQAGEAGYSGSFVQYWLQELLYYQAPAWVFILAYTLFGLLVVLTWWYCPPRSRRKKR